MAMKPVIKNPLVDDVAQLLGGVRDGHRYRLTIDSPTGPKTGIVKAEVKPPKIEVIPGQITLVMDGETMNENQLYPGPIEKIVSIEELP
jgi:hypothetical protein